MSWVANEQKTRDPTSQSAERVTEAMATPTLEWHARTDMQCCSLFFLFFLFRFRFRWSLARLGRGLS